MKKLSNEEKCYYEEIIFLFAVIIALFCYSQGYIILTLLFVLKAGCDFYAATKYAIKSIINERKSK